MPVNPELLDRLRSDLAVFWPDRFRLDRVSHPEDWLVFADALLDEGDERGELIDLERRFTETGHRAYDFARERKATNGRRHAIPARFMGPGNPLLPHGFVSSVQLGPRALEELADVLTHRDARLISMLHLQDPARANRSSPNALVEALAAHPALAQLRGLAIPQTIDAAATARLVALPHFRKLSAVSLQLEPSALPELLSGPWRPRRAVLSWSEPVGVTAFSNAPAFERLEELVLRGPLGDEAAAALVPHLGQLRSLTLIGRGPGGTRAFAMAPGMARLEEVDLLRSRASLSDVAALVAGPERPALRAVRVRCGSLIGQVGTVQVPKGSSPVDLELFEPMGETAALPALARSRALTRARSIRISGGHASSARALERASPLAELRTLDLRASGLDEGSLRRLLRGRFPKLERLWLDDNPLGDEGLGHLATWQGVSQLVELRVRGTQTTAAGVAALVSFEVLGQLRTLHLDPENADAAAEFLAAAETLRPHDLAFTSLPMGPGAVRVLAVSPVLSEVRRLTLPGEALTPEALEALLDSPYLGHLEVLDLRPRPHLTSRLPESSEPQLRRAAKAWPRLHDVVGVAPGLWIDP